MRVWTRGLPSEFVPITAGFIEIVLPDQAQGTQVVRISSSLDFEAIVSEIDGSNDFAFVPFYTREDGLIEFRVAPVEGVITFALMDVPGF